MAVVSSRRAASLFRRSSTWAGRVAVSIVLLVMVNPVAALGTSGPAHAASVAATSTAHAGVHDPVLQAQASLATGAGPARGALLSCTGQGAIQCTGAPPAAPHPSVAPPPVWTDLTPKVTGAVPYRYLGAMAYDPVDHYVVLFGGEGNGTTYGDTWSYANGVWTQLNPSSSPSQRYVAMATWDAGDGYMLLFGGYDASTAATNNETWSFVGGQWTQHTPSVLPPARWRGVLGYDAVDNYSVLFGGSSDGAGTNILHDTWTYSAGTWTQLSLTSYPAGRIRSEMTYDPADGYLLMFGGCTSSACASAAQDTWTYVGGVWTQQSPTTKPAERAYEGLTYDPSQGYVLMYGGEAYATVSTTHDTWSYLAGNWTDLSSSFTTYPAARAYEMIAYDAADGYTLLFGGQQTPNGATFSGDTWAFGPSVIGTFGVTPATIDLGQGTTFNATPLSYSGTANFSYLGLPPGCASADVPVLACTPTQAGIYLVTSSVNDSNGFPVQKDATLLVNPDPAITGAQLTPSVVTSGSRFYLNLSVANGTLPYSYAYSGLPAGCTSSNTPTYSCAPTGTGVFTIGVTVHDSVGSIVTTSAGVTVNTQPSLQSFKILPSVIDLGESVTLWTNASGGTAPLSYTYTGLPPGCAPADVPMLVCTPTAVGIVDVSVNATDSFGWRAGGGAAFTVNTPPSILEFNLEPRAIDLGGSFTLWFNTTGGTGALSLSYAGLPTGCSIGAAASGACSPVDSGAFNVTATVTDTRGITAAMTVQLAVVPDPAITAVTVSPSSIDVGQNLTITVAILGGTAPYQFLYTNLPTGCSGASTAIVSCKPRTPSVYLITAQVTDVWKQSSSLGATFTVNAAPAIASFNASSPTVTLGDSTTFHTVAQYGSGTFTYSYAGLPAGCASTNRSAVVCTPTATGTFNVSVSVTDTLGLSANSTTLVTVVAAQSSSEFLGFSGSTGYLLVAAILVIVVVALVLLMVMRRRRAAPPAAPAAWEENPAESDPPA